MSAHFPAASSDEFIDVSDVLRSLNRKRWWLLGALLGGALVGLLLALVITPVYRATAVLVPVNSDRMSSVLGSALGQFGGLASIAGINVGSRGSESEEALAVLRSRQFTEAFISDLDLLPKLFPRKWDAAKHEWKVPPEKRPTLARANKRFREDIRTIDQDKKTGLVTVQIDWTDRQEAAAWTNLLVQRLNQEMRRRAIATAENSVGFLERELQATNEVATREAISRVIESQIKQRMLANVTEEYAFRVVDKAMPPDADDPVEPNKLRLILIGAFLGFAACAAWALGAGARRNRELAAVGK